MQKLIILFGLLVCVAAVLAQERERPQRRGGPGGFGGPIDLVLTTSKPTPILRRASLAGARRYRTAS